MISTSAGSVRQASAIAGRIGTAGVALPGPWEKLLERNREKQILIDKKKSER